MNHIAIIDLGTNTFNLLIVEVNTDKTYKHLYKTKVSVRLGEGGISKGFIAPLPFQRGINALRGFKKTIENYNVKRIFALATSAIRGANNGSEFISNVNREIGIDIQIISGDKEAELVYFGVRDAVEMNADNSLIIDIGGGSTEFIIANNQTILWKQSFLLGVARLLEKYKPTDPITEKEINELTLYLNQELKPLFDAVQKYPVTELIGSSGSFDSLAEMIAHKFYTPHILENKTEFTFNLNDFKAIYIDILKSDKAMRLTMKGLIEMRVDMIVMSSILVHFIVSSLAIKKMRLSTYSLKEGALYEMLND